MQNLIGHICKTARQELVTQREAYFLLPVKPATRKLCVKMDRWYMMWCFEIRMRKSKVQGRERRDDTMSQRFYLCFIATSIADSEPAAPRKEREVSGEESFKVKPHVDRSLYKSEKMYKKQTNLSLLLHLCFLSLPPPSHLHSTARDNTKSGFVATTFTPRQHCNVAM